MSEHRARSAVGATFREAPLAFLLRPFAEVRAGEAGTVLLMAANVFVLLMAYYLLKVAREPLVLLAGGAEVKAYAAAGQAVLLVGVSLAYAELARRVGKMKLLAAVSLFFLSNLVVFFGLGRRGVEVGVAFYLWVGIFSLTTIAQFWSFASDLCTVEQGKRLFPFIGIGSSLGSVVGAATAKKLIGLGPYGLMLAAAGLLVLCLGMTWAANALGMPRSADDPPHEDAPLGRESGFAAILRDKYLLALAGLAVAINAVTTNGEYLLDRALLARAASAAAVEGVSVGAYIGAFKADYFAWVSGVGVFLQLFVVSRIVKHVGLRSALFFMPIVSLGAYASMAIAPVLALLFVVKVAENALGYSLQNTATQALWLVTARDEKYKAKQVVDTLFVRLGDVASAGVVWLGTRLGLGTASFAMVNVAIVTGWLAIVVVLGREHARRTSEAGADSTPGTAPVRAA